MKTQITLIFWLLILLSVSTSIGQPASFTNFTKSVHYVPPAGFQLENYFIDSGEKDWPRDLFNYMGSGVQYNANRGGHVLFMLKPSCYDSPKGRFPGAFFPRTTKDVKNDFDWYYRAMWITNMPPAKIGKTAGYTCVSASYQQPKIDNMTNFFYACWIPVESNIVVTVEIQTGCKSDFDAATNSLKTLKINKKEIINITTSPAP